MQSESAQCPVLTDGVDVAEGPAKQQPLRSFLSSECISAALLEHQLPAYAFAQGVHGRTALQAHVRGIHPVALTSAASIAALAGREAPKVPHPIRLWAAHHD
eukprot:15449008-Alexandrium_andersonii.AAC.1